MKFDEMKFSAKPFRDVRDTVTFRGNLAVDRFSNCRRKIHRHARTNYADKFRRRYEISYIFLERFSDQEIVRWQRGSRTITSDRTVHDNSLSVSFELVVIILIPPSNARYSFNRLFYIYTNHVVLCKLIIFFVESTKTSLLPFLRRVIFERK